ncbi:hypothetical protein RCG23_13205 [Neobacillus sp. PS3-34]|uniref:hypothetical protein n=1 Tax=Neobacillus sp. PS3-34 TaxID=3070678 RepID=UPI0027E19B68|nr:hypothetical protein [Neobacillus sp. PS3-34]WML46613.1 hypothetical protein RCG23_13205 [Neobacillus sp. PS3-34]
MNKMIQILSSKQLIAVFSFCSLLNYYLIAVFIAVNYDVANELAGGPASMFTAFTFRPIAAAGLAFPHL